MRRNSLLFTLVFILSLAAVPTQAQQARPNTGRQATQRVWTNKDVDDLRAAKSTQANHVWTDGDMDKLRAKDLVSIVGLNEIESAAARPSGAPAGAESAPPQLTAPGPAYNSRFGDPRWYEQQAAAIQEQIDGTMTTLNQARTNLDNARRLSGETGTIHIDQGNIGMTPEEGIARLEEQVRALQKQKDELADVARRYSIPPGVVRSAS